MHLICTRKKQKNAPHKEPWWKFTKYLDIKCLAGLTIFTCLPHYFAFPFLHLPSPLCTLYIYSLIYPYPILWRGLGTERYVQLYLTYTRVLIIAKQFVIPKITAHRCLCTNYWSTWWYGGRLEGLKGNWCEKVHGLILVGKSDAISFKWNRRKKGYRIVKFAQSCGWEVDIKLIT